MNSIKQKDIPYGSLLVPIGNSIKIFNESELKEAHEKLINSKKGLFFNRIRDKLTPRFIKIKKKNTFVPESRISIINYHEPLEKNEIWNINSSIDKDFFQIPEIKQNTENIIYH